MKAFIIFVGIIICLFYFGNSQCSNNNTSLSSGSKKTYTKIDNISNLLSKEEQIGWEFTHTASDYNWFKPKQINQTTSWFDMEGYNTTYMAKSCIVDFRDRNDESKIHTFKIDPEGKTFKYTNGVCDKDIIQEDEFLNIRMNSCEMRFRPSGDGSDLSIKVGRK